MSVQEKMVIKFIIDLVLDKVFNTFLNLKGILCLNQKL